MNAPMIHVGADVSKLKAALPDITKAILAILGSQAGDDVKKAALEVLSKQFSVENVSIMDSHFESNVNRSKP